MFNIKLISLNGFFILDKNEQEIDIIDEYISSEFFKQMEIIYDVFTVDCDICSNEAEFKNSLISSIKDNDAVVILGGLSNKSKINAKQLVATGLGLDIGQNEEIKEKNKEFCIKQGMEYSDDVDFKSFIPMGSYPFLMESSISDSYVLNLNGKFIIHTSHDENEVKKCLGTKVIPYLLENTQNTASVEEICLTGLSEKQIETFPIKNQKDVSFCMYKVGKEVRGRIVVNKSNVKKSEKYMDKLFDKIEKWANGDYLRKEIKENKKLNNKSFWSKIFPSKNDDNKAKIKKSILMLCAIVFIASMGFIGVHYLKSYINDKKYDNLTNLYKETSDIPQGYPDDYLPEFASLYKANEDIKGYIKVKGTHIDYPVVQKGDNDYYSTKNFNGEKSEYGVPFLDYEVDLINSKNFIIYGNNMKDGQMFSDFVKYKYLSFYKEHPLIQFDNVYEEGTYKIISIFRTTANKKHKDIFNYQNFVSPMNEEETKEFLTEISKRTMINTGVSYDENDRFLTLSTCTYEFDDARFVVVARKVRDGESAVVDTDKATVNKNALMPDMWYELYGGTKPTFDDKEFKKTVDSVLAETSADEEKEDETTKDTDKNNDNVKVNSVKLNQNEGMLYAGVTYKLSAIVYPENAANKKVVWKSDNEEVVKTDQNGKIVAVSEGIANISATSEDGSFSDSCKITVKTDGIKVTGISLDKNSAILKKGQNLSLKATITPTDAKNKNVLWESSDNKVATVDKNGNITAVSVGNAKITARTEDGGKIANFNLTVKADETIANEIVLNKEKLTLNIGDEYNFTAKVYPENATNQKVTYECSNTNIVSVYADGTIKALKEGKVTIKALVKGTDAFAECVVDVVLKEEEKQVEQTISSGDEITVKNQSGERITDTPYNIICQITQGEVGGGFSVEAIKAQAVAAYTYVMYNINKGVVPSVVMAESVTSKIKNAVTDVIGQAVYYNGKYINAVYHAASSGYTTSADKVWGGGSVPYLVPVESTGDEKCKYYGYEKTFSEKDIASRIEDYFDIDPYDYGDAENWFEDIKTDSGGYVDSIKVCGNKITGRKFREGLMSFSICSHAFEVDYNDESFAITTYGYGHGVGMSQYGAQHLASEGYTYDEILKHYYTGTTVK